MQPCLHPHGYNSRGCPLSSCADCLQSQTLSSFILVSSVLLFSPLLHLITCLIEFHFITHHVATSTLTPSLVDTAMLCSCPTCLDWSYHITWCPCTTHPRLQTSYPWSLAVCPPLSTHLFPWLDASPVHTPPVHATCVWTCRWWAHTLSLFTTAQWPYLPRSLPIIRTP